MQSPMKACPQCGTGAALNAQSCARCGHTFRTQFIPPAPMQQTQMFYAPVKPKSGLLKGIAIVSGGGCFALFALMLLAFMTTAKHKRLEPGPETVALGQQMKSMEMRPFDAFVYRFGYPTHTTTMSVSGVDYAMWEYKCKDGDVFAAVNKPLGIIERVDVEGLEQP